MKRRWRFKKKIIIEEPTIKINKEEAEIIKLNILSSGVLVPGEHKLFLKIKEWLKK